MITDNISKTIGILILLVGYACTTYCLVTNAQGESPFRLVALLISSQCFFSLIIIRILGATIKRYRNVSL